MFLRILSIILSMPFVFIILHTIVRIVRAFYKFPMPEWMADFIDNPLRRKIQPPDVTAIRQGIKPGMRVLEVGPGSGTYTLAAARLIGPDGILITVDIEPKMIDRVNKRIEAESVTNIDARVADVCDLPFEDASFDLVYMITVINEIPDIPKALAEFHRVLKPAGVLSFSECITDPDYPLAGRLRRKVEAVNFQFKEKIGNFIIYTLVFVKCDA